MSTGTAVDVFLSYHWRDHAQVEAVARWLRDQGLKVFLDRWYLLAGRPWPQALGNCRAVSVFEGPGEMGPWLRRSRPVKAAGGGGAGPAGTSTCCFPQPRSPRVTVYGGGNPTRSRSSLFAPVRIRFGPRGWRPFAP
jgi:TIR domain